MAYWLMKSEPSECSIDDLYSMPDQIVEWTGVRNYQARNFMRDQMSLGDLAFFWHSSCAEPGIAGIVQICSLPHPDSSQFDAQNEYYDPKSSLENPRWICVDVQYKQHTPLISPKMLRNYSHLSDMKVLMRGNRLSITPVCENHWTWIFCHLIEQNNEQKKWL